MFLEMVNAKDEFLKKQIHGTSHPCQVLFQGLHFIFSKFNPYNNPMRHALLTTLAFR